MINRRHTNRAPIGVLISVLLFLFVALMAPVLSNNKPILIYHDSGLHFPVISSNSAFKYPIEPSSYSFALHPPVPYLPTDIDLNQSGVPPFSLAENNPWYFCHWLGTDEIGRDVLSHLIYGCRSSMIIATGAMIVALIVGLFLGSLGGYWHGRQLQLSWLGAMIALVLLVIFINGFTALGHRISAFGTWLLILTWGALLVLIITRLQNRFKFKRNLFPKITLSPDAWVVRLINFFTAMPAYFALLAFLAIWPEPTTTGIAAVLGLLMWPDLTRLTRGAIIQLRNTGLSEAAESLGYSPFRVMFRHLLPNAVQPALVALSFGIGGAIMAESFLSFVGIAPAEMVSWGTLLAKTRSYPEMWWLSVFPGLAILAAILTFYRLAAVLQETD